MNIKFSPPDISQDEIDEVVDALKSGWITTGPKTKLFENNISNFCGTNSTVCLNSATAGLELILRVLGIGSGDEVITSAYTYTASASVIEHVGAKIVLCDIGENSLDMDYDKLSSLITGKTKAIIAVDVAGIICDYDTIYKIVEKKKSIFKANSILQEKLGRIAVIADAAHSFGANKNGQKSGNIADFTSFSFHAVKNLTTAEGGAVTWKSCLGVDSDEIYKQFKLWSLHGQNKDALSKTQAGSWEYDIIMCGQKCNMTDIMASIGLAQLKRYQALLERRKTIIQAYEQGLKDCGIVTLNHYGNDFSSSGHLFITRVKGIDEKCRNEIIIKMGQKGVPCNVHYKPLPMFTAYKNLGFDIKDYPNAYSAYVNEITLPLHTLLSDEDVEYIIDSYKESLC